MAELKEAIELLGKIENKVSVPCHVNTSRCGNCGECMWCWLKQVFILLRKAPEQPPEGEPISLERQNEILFEANKNIKVRLDRSEASRKELLTALEPFAKCADLIPSRYAPEPQWAKFNTKIQHLSLDRYREAKAAIKANKEGDTREKIERKLWKRK